MSIIQAAGSGEVSTGFYKLLLDQSLKFDQNKSSALSRTPASAGNQRLWTFSAWVKKSTLDIDGYLLGVGTASAFEFIKISNSSTDQFEYAYWNGSVYVYQVRATALLRDTSAWYHIVLAVDTAQGTAANRVKFYVNGTQLTDFSISTYPTQNADTRTNAAVDHRIGSGIGGAYFDGYIAEVNFIDGAALTPSSFGETKNGIWIPKDTSGLTFGTNGFHLTFKDDVVSEGFNTAIYEGNSTTQSISGLGFSPGLVWVKDRDNGNSHAWSDVVRGRGRNLISNATNAEVSADAATDKDLISFDADGFSVGQFEDGTYNNNGSSMVAWCWEAGGAPTATNSAGAGATPTAGSVKIDGSNLGSALAGSIAATKLSANTARGFSIGTFTKGSGNETVAHGLGAAPDWLIVKRLDGTGSWAVYHSANTANPETDYLRLNSTDATADDSTFWGDTAPTSTVFTVGAAFNSGEDLVFYAWTDITSYSKFDSYTGNGSTTGPTVTTGFRPAWLMVKATSGSEPWNIVDATREGQDKKVEILQPNSSSATVSMSSPSNVEFTDTGFKINTNIGNYNTNSTEYIYMAFADTREAAFFKDVSSNGNHFTPVNLDYRDSVPDVPTNNFATLNPLVGTLSDTYSEGNLKLATTLSNAVYSHNRATHGFSSGKWYFEFLWNATASAYGIFGIVADTVNPDTQYAGQGDSYSYRSDNGNKITGGTASSYGASFTTGDIIGIAVDMDNGTLTFYKNGSTQGQAFTGISGTYFPACSDLDNNSSRNSTFTFNAGQDSSFAGAIATANSNADGNGHGSFAYAPPSGFLALCSQNLPDVAIIDGTENFNTVLYTGTGSSRSVTGVGFRPDWIWMKSRSDASGHRYYDVVRGAGKGLSTHSTGEEYTETGLTSFDSDGFSLGTQAGTNGSGTSMVAWNWLAGGSAVTNNNGSITSSVSANTTAGFSIVTWTGDGGQTTVGHGLGATPKIVIQKKRSGTSDWWFYTTAVDGSYDYLKLNSTGAKSDYAQTAPTSTTFVSHGWGSDTMVAYCFAEISGYSKMSSYTGNGNADGTYVHLGFRPALIILKRTDSAVGWMIIDNKRDPFNVADARLNPNSSGSEGTNVDFADYLSNGFKLRTSDSGFNASGGTYIYLAFADQPFKFSNAR